MNDKQLYDIGLVGLGTMGRNLALNIVDHGFTVAGYDQDEAKIETLKHEAGGQGETAIGGAGSLAELAGALRPPRAVLLLVPAGAPVDAVIQGVLPGLSAGDIILDSGNSHFGDTDRRLKELAGRGIHLLGVGISGGAHGARRGASIMPGGERGAYERVRPILEAVAAKVPEEGGEPCVTYLGPGSAGHYVKMVHNGIEYGLMQLISETYDVLKRGLDLGPEALHGIYDQWNRTEAAGYLLEITAQIMLEKDPKAGGYLIDHILDRAHQKGTGKWMSQEAMELEVPAPIIDAGVSMRNLSVLKEERGVAGKVLAGPDTTYTGQQSVLLRLLHNALYAASIMAYGQGMELLRTGSAAHGYDLDLEAVARIWRGGCIIRAAVLDDIRAAYRRDPRLRNLLLDASLGRAVAERQEDLRAMVHTAAVLGIPVPGQMAALAYYDGYRSARLPANLIQAQRDYFGAHTYERVDVEGTFHTEWGQG